VNPLHQSLRDLIALSKPGIVIMCLVEAAGGLWLAPGSASVATWLWTFLGLTLVVASSNAWNMLWEREGDKHMERTRNRPLPSGRMKPATAATFAVVTGIGSLLVFATQVNVLSAWLALASMFSYVLIYTPLKRVTTLNTIVGAVVGAIPPMIGWAAASDGLQRGAWVLGVLLFTWQLPHFFALAWLHREDYERGGFRMLPSVPGGEMIAAQTSVLASLLLVPIGLMATLLGLAGIGSAIVCALAGLVMTWYAVAHLRRLDRVTARDLFLASLAYLPVVLLALSLDRGPTSGVAGARGGRTVLQESR